MSGKQQSINIDGVAATKALEALRKHAELPRKGKTDVEKAEGDLLRLIVGLKDKDEYKREKEVLINLRCSIDNKDENYEIVFITKGDSSKLRGKLDSVAHLSTYMSLESLKKIVSTKEGKAEFLKQYRYILCDVRVKRNISFLLGSSLISKGRIIPIVINDVPIETVIRNIRVLLKSYLIRINGSCIELKIGRTKMENKKIIANYNSVMGQILENVKAEDILSLSLKTDYSVSFPIYETSPEIKLKYEPEVSAYDKKQLMRKEKRLKRLNSSRIKKEVIPQIKPHKPL